MIMDRPDIGSNPRLTFFYFEAQAPTSPRLRAAQDSAGVERTYFIPHVFPHFANPLDAQTKILKAFLGRQERADAGAGGRRIIKRLTPMPDPARPKCFAQSLNLEIVGASEAMQFLNTSVPDEAGGPSVQAAIPAAEGGAVYKAVVYYSALTYKVMTDDALQTQIRFNFARYGDPTPIGNAVGSVIADEASGLALRTPRYMTILGDTAPRVFTIPKSIMLLADPLVKESLFQGLPVSWPDKEFMVNWHSVPDNCLPEFAWLEGNGAVNDKPFGIYPPGTLLFQGEKRRPRVGPLGDVLYDVMLHFRFRGRLDNPKDAMRALQEEFRRLFAPNLPKNRPQVRGWNYQPCVRPLTDGTQGLVTRRTNTERDGTGSDAYNGFDFLRLFRPPQVGED